MMNWPSMMSLAPPPVTPSRKFPPRLGAPAAPVVAPALGVEELEPHAAANPPAAARPAAPMRSCRRETSVMSCPFCPPALAVPPPGPACVLADKGPGDVLMAVGSQHESVGGRRALPRIRPYSTLEVRNARVKLCVPWLVSGRGLRDEPAGRETAARPLTLLVAWASPARQPVR